MGRARQRDEGRAGGEQRCEVVVGRLARLERNGGASQGRANGHAKANEEESVRRHAGALQSTGCGGGAAAAAGRPLELRNSAEAVLSEHGSSAVLLNSSQGHDCEPLAGGAA